MCTECVCVCVGGVAISISRQRCPLPCRCTGSARLGRRFVSALSRCFSRRDAVGSSGRCGLWGGPPYCYPLLLRYSSPYRPAMEAGDSAGAGRRVSYVCRSARAAVLSLPGAATLSNSSSCGGDPQPQNYFIATP